MKRTNSLIAAALVVGAGLSSPAAHASEFNLDNCLAAEQGTLWRMLAIDCPKVVAALRPACIALAYGSYAVGQAACYQSAALAAMPAAPIVSGPVTAYPREHTD